MHKKADPFLALPFRCPPSFQRVTWGEGRVYFRPVNFRKRIGFYKNEARGYIPPVGDVGVYGVPSDQISTTKSGSLPPKSELNSSPNNPAT